MASEVKTNKISPATSTTINVGDSGDTLALATDAVTGFNVGSDAQGDVLYHDGTDYTRLAAGTSGYYLKTQGTSANPVWADAAYSPSPVCFIYANSDQTGVSDATWTKATNMAGVFINEDTAYNTSTQTFTVPVGKAGKYYVEATCVPGSGAVSVLYTVGVAIYLNTAVKRLGSFNMSNSAGHKMTAYVSAILDLAEGDDLEVYGYGDMSTGTPAFYQGITSGGTFLCWRLSA